MGHAADMSLRALVVSRSAERDLERLGEISDQVFARLDPDGKADERIGDPDRLALLSGELEVGHERRLLDEGLHRSERGRDGGELAGVDEARGALRVRVELEGDAAAGALHLLARDAMIGMALETRIPDAADAPIRLEVACDLQCALVLPLDAQGEGLHAA